MKNVDLKQDSRACGKRLFGRLASRWAMLALMVPVLLASSCSKDDTESGGYPMPPATTFTATPGNAQVALSWTAPESSHIKEYSLTWSPGSGSATVKSGTTYMVTGLENDKEYTFSLVVVYDAGKSDAKTAKATPKGELINYEPCTELKALPGDKSISLTWTRPAPVEKATLAGYTVTVRPQDVKPVKIDDPEAVAYTVNGLTNDKTYTVEVVANYDSGNSLAASVSATPVAPDLNWYFQIQKGSQRNVKLDSTENKAGYMEYTMTSTSGDPYFATTKLPKDLQEDLVVLTFEYKASQPISDLQIFFSPIAEARSIRGYTIPMSSSWKSWSLVVKKQIKDFSWGKKNDYLRIDLGAESGKTISMRKIHFRTMTPEEIQQEQEEEEKQQSAQKFEDNLKSYLTKSYAAKVTEVNAGSDKITISGSYTGTGDFSLVEIPVYQDAVKLTEIEFEQKLTSNSFSVSVDRYITREGIKYDRTLSKWAVVKTGANNKKELASTARYPDRIDATRSPAALKPATKKGLGGFFMNAYTSDLDDLGITSVTMNITPTQIMHLNNDGNLIAHEYGGRTYYFDRGTVNNWDATLRECYKRNIVVSAIVLIVKADACQDKEVGRLTQHPDLSGGNYSMPNMTTPESVDAYAAALDFMASRYCTADGANGRIHHWIMHNEVDAGTEWTNMGHKMVTTYTDAYVKSMRMCYNIARRYDPNTQVLASFTHSWTQPSDYATLDMINLLKSYSKAEGDFQWGLAYHPYPQNLLEPKTWLDNQATYSMSTPLVTFKNLEVLSKWAMNTDNWFRGVIKRTVYLSENGTNSPSYSEKDLAEQAAGFAWAWKKIEALDGIDAIQWHNWIDNRVEYGLRIGLRKFSDEPGDPGGRKPVWFAYQAAGTATEDEVFAPYLSVIGISNWDILKPVN